MTLANESSERSSGVEPGELCCPIVELRQYTLHPGTRDVLIDLFDREFIETQEAVGMRVIGQFRDLDDPNRFVWLRGFPDMTARAESLKEFYGGPVWKAHREAAVATMIDSDNVLLLRPACPTNGFSLEIGKHPPPGSNETVQGLVVATVYYLAARADAELVGFFEDTVKPLLADSGASILGSFVTEESPNTFPSLPVREGEHVLVWFARFRDQAAYEDHVTALARSQQWSGEVSTRLASLIKAPPKILKLAPTSRSQLRG